MNKNNVMKTIVSFSFAVALVIAGVAEESPCGTFGKWRVGIGAAFNSQVSADIGMRNLTIPIGYAVPAGSTKADALYRAQSRRYDGGGYVDSDSLDSGFDTENWQLPVSAYRGNGHFALDNAYQEVIGTSVDYARRDNSDDRNQFGISIEAARELWIYDENAEHRWGIDFAAAFSYFFGRDIYSARSTVTRTDAVMDGVIRTDINDADAMYDYDHGLDSPVNGMYGYGNFNRTMAHPALGFAGIGDPYDVGGPSRPVSSSLGYSANGDYQELEMLFMFRPWYEITDWWRVFAEAGLGVSWGRFDTTFYGNGGSYDDVFLQWDCYGVAGIGTSFRYENYTLSIDVLGRFLRDDLDVDGKYLKGSLERADWGLRLMVGYEF